MADCLDRLYHQMNMLWNNLIGFMIRMITPLFFYRLWWMLRKKIRNWYKNWKICLTSIRRTNNMEEQGAVYSIYQFCTIYTTITSMLWVSVFAVLIIFLGRSLNFKRNYSFNVLWALVILFFLRFILNFEIPYYTSGLRSYVYLEAVREALRHCLYIFLMKMILEKFTIIWL